jgi:hypothetical protein
LKNIGRDFGPALHFLFKLVEFEEFITEFISEDGLEALSALTWPPPDSPCAECLAIDTPMRALLVLTKGTSFVDTLPVKLLCKLLQSPLVSRETVLSKAAAEFLRFTQRVYKALSDLPGEDEVFPEAASICAQILNQVLIYQQLDPLHWEQEATLYSDADDFDQFCYDTRQLINELRGIEQGDFILAPTDSVSEVFEHTKLL